MSVFIVVAVSLGGLVEILPLIFQNQVSVPAEGVKPYPPLQLAGRDIYVREGCYNCHSQMIRPFRSETERYGPYSVAGESVYDRPFQWGSKRTGPDLARVGGRYSDDWHVIHLINPRDVVPESNMPGYPWLLENTRRWRTGPEEDERAANAGRPVHRRRDRRGGGRRQRQDRNGGAGRLPARPGPRAQRTLNHAGRV